MDRKEVNIENDGLLVLEDREVIILSFSSSSTLSSSRTNHLVSYAGRQGDKRRNHPSSSSNRQSSIASVWFSLCGTACGFLFSFVSCQPQEFRNKK